MGRAGTLPFLLPALAFALLTTACDDAIGDAAWTSSIDTVTLYSLAVPDLARESAFNFSSRTSVHIEAADAERQWDAAVDTRLGLLVLDPPGALGVTSRARVAVLPGQSFTTATEAPADTMLYSATTPVPLLLTNTYVVKTDERSTPFGGTCQYFAKLQPIAIDVPSGTLRFIYDVSPVCNDRRLVPPDSLK